MHQGQHGGKPRQTVPKGESTSKLHSSAPSQKIDDLARSHGLRWLVRLDRMFALRTQVFGATVLSRRHTSPKLRLLYARY